jgi:protein phosphatase
MLVCPDCQFENPETHKFCQRCGTSLVEKVCQVCDTLVSFSSEYCLQCGAVTGTIWKAILFPTNVQAFGSSGLFDLSQAAVSQPVFDSADAAMAIGVPLGMPPDLPPMPQTITLPTGKFLDLQQRYQLLDPLPQQIGPMATAEARVLDHQPLQVTSLPQTAQSSPQSTQAAAEARDIPAIAQPYLALQSQFPLLPLPHLHDAWQQQDFTVLLLDDRSALPLLVDLWLDEAVEPLQILHWLHQMSELWGALESQYCCQSLLELSNLRVDEDYLLCLQRLYVDQPDQPASLAQLGSLWRQLFQQSQRTQNAELAKLYADLESETILSLTQLRARIETVAATLQAPPQAGFQADSQAVSIDSKPANPEVFSAQIPQLQTSSTEITQDLPPRLPVSPVRPTASQPASRFGSNSNGVANDYEDDNCGPITSSNEDTDDENSSDDLPTVVLSMRLASLEDSGCTDIGRQRNHNEDCFSIQTEIRRKETPQGRVVQAKGLYILCDGMGGHASGEVASAMAVTTLQQYFTEHWQDKLPSEDKIRAGIQLANQMLYDQNQQNASAGSGRMGTTLVLLLIHNAEAAIAHVGDSRLYRLSRRHGLQQLTTDHEVGQREIQRGVEPAIAYARPDAYQLTQALGPRDENFLSPDIKFMELKEDGVLLLCSDGLSDNDLLEAHYSTYLEPMLNQQTNLERGVNQLIDLANQHNGHDNITAIAVRFKVRPNLEQITR